jgi:hypothetical protein
VREDRRRAPRRRTRRRARGSRCWRPTPALLLGAGRAEHDVRDRREEERHADARDDERDHERRCTASSASRRRDPAEPDRLQREPDAHDPLAADPVGQRPAIGAMKIGIAVQGGSAGPT